MPRDEESPVSTTSIIDLLSGEAEVPDIRIVDVGANPLTGRKGPYQPLVDRGLASLVGFEPDPEAFARWRPCAWTTSTTSPPWTT